MEILNFDNFVGQEQLINNIVKPLLKVKKFPSCIFYGPSGCGKTTLAKIIANELNIKDTIFLNATTLSQKDLTSATENTDNPKIIIIDEIHRLNKTKQEFLLSFLEKPNLTLIGLTTTNPYYSIDSAIRSRCQLFELKALNNEDILKGLNNLSINGDIKFTKEVLDNIVNISKGDMRYAINQYELLSNIALGKNCTLVDMETYKELNPKISCGNMGSKDFHYDVISAFQKSIRGSDTDAALYYLGLLCKMDDLDTIIRRLLVIAYEDIGIADLGLCGSVKAGIDTCLMIGLPEASIILADLVISLCLSPKSKTGHDAIKEVNRLIDKRVYDVPDYLKANNKIYDHDRKDCYPKIQYLPDAIKDEKFIKGFRNNPTESSYNKFYNLLRKNRSSNLKALYENKS